MCASSSRSWYPDLPISQVNTLAETIRAGAAFFNIFGVIFTVFGGSALILAAIGLYGVLSFNVNQRQHELGLRLALGASRLRVVRLVLGQTGFQLAMGMMIGAGLAMLLGRGLSFVLFGVAPSDGSVFAGVTALLALTALVACLVPLRRATSVDPTVAMHAE